jgi:predicted aspartyl protease
MKIKQVYISDENFEKLIGINASALVNELLQEHFQSTEIKTMTPEQRAQRIAVLEIEIEAERKVRELENAAKN